MGGDDSHFQTQDQIKLFYSTAGGLKRPSFINDLITLAFHHYIMYTVHMHLCTHTYYIFIYIY